MIDLHSHVLPGVDDGPRTSTDALALLRRMVDDGITTVVATPHMLDGHYDVELDRMAHEVLQLSRLARDEELPITILPGGELFVRHDLPGLIRAKSVPTVGNHGRYVLVESPYQLIPPDFKRVMFEIQMANVVPILAHPERCYAIQKNPEYLEALVEAGTVVQVNASSIVGDFGATVARTAWALLERGLVHVVSSDAHHAERRPPRMTAARDLLVTRMGSEETYRLLRDRPLKILEGRPFSQPTRGKARPWWRRMVQRQRL